MDAVAECYGAPTTTFMKNMEELRDFQRDSTTDMDKFLTELQAKYKHIVSLGVQVHTFHIGVMVLRNSNITELRRTLVLTATGGSLECSAICRALKTLCRLPTTVGAAHLNQNEGGDGHSGQTFLGK